MTHSKTDVVVIGAGPAGLAFVNELTQRCPGKSVTLIEKSEIGGANITSGSIPSKHLLHLAKKYHAGDKTLSSDKILVAVRKKIDELQGEQDELSLQKLGVDVVKGEPVFKNRRTIIINDTQIKFKYCVIATGSSSRRVSVQGLNEKTVITAETIFGLKKIPKKLLIVGAGRTSIELAQSLAMLGSKVTILNQEDELLPKLNKEVRHLLEDSLKDHGVHIINGAHLQRIMDDTTARVEHTGVISKSTFDHIFFASGREPNMPLELKKAHVKARSEGIPTNLKHQTTNHRIFAIGDVASKSHFTHIAIDQASDVVEFIANRRSRLKHKPRPLVPALLFTTPQLATVGYSYQEAIKVHRKRSIRKISVPYWINDRAKTEDEMNGVLTVVVKRRNGAIVGAQIAGVHAAEMISTFCIAMEYNLTLPDLGSTVLPYPSYSELINEASKKYFAS